MKNFCVVPWFSDEIILPTGERSICCWLRNPVDVNVLRQDIINDNRPSACKKCWDSEDSGIESRRQMENRFLDYALDKDLENIKQDVVDGKFEPLLYQINLGSLCNSTCVTCGPGVSTAWQSLLKNQISIKIENSSVDNHFDRIKDQVNWKNLKRINLLGGEPLLIQKHVDILTKLLEHGNTTCLISFVTNGSVTLNQKQLDLFKQFKNISCCVSIDGVGDTFEYIRYPLSWNQLLRNLEQYRKVFNDVVVSFTVSNLNVYEKSSIIEWFNHQGLLYIENYVYEPACFNVDVKPGHVLWPWFVKEIERQDKLKGISIDNYIPYVANLIKG